ncbi:amidohydrolase family protein [Flavobacteriaceae bacterium R38]|nr:amidohydrolase family protein [Flavobacteriaceae bacterium R38]
MKNRLQPIVVYLLLICLLQSCKDQLKGDLIIKNVNIVNVETGNIDPNMDIVIVDDRIKSIIKHSDNTVYISENIYEGSGKYLIPGLWDMHVHLSMIGKESLPLFVLNGVTGVRDMGGDWSKLKSWRERGDEIRQNTFPKIKTAGPILESPQFYDVLQQILGPNYVKDRIKIDSPERANKVVDSLSEMGVDLVKIRTVLSQDVFKAIADACKRNVISFTGHIDENIGIDFAVENGIETVEHDLFLQVLKMNNEEIKKVLETVSKSEVDFTPTLLAKYNTRLRPKNELIELLNDSLNYNKYRQYLSPKLIENWNIQITIQGLERPMKWDSLVVPLRSFSKLLSKEVNILAGTDSGVPGIIPGVGIHEELKMMVEELEVTNLEALQSATINATTNLKLENEYGLVKANFKADLLVLDANPLDDIANTFKINYVIKNGIVINKEDRESKLIRMTEAVKNESETYSPETLTYLKEIIKIMTSGSDQ